MNRTALYFAANVLFLVLVAAGMAISPGTGVHAIYVILLFALCSSPLLEMQALNDRFLLLGLFSAYYFIMYGLQDVLLLFSGMATAHGDESVISEPELLVLAGGLLATLGYRFACRARNADQPGTTMDWSPASLLWVGLVLWIGCTAMNWEFNVYVVPDATAATARKGLAGLGNLLTTGFMLARLAQPMGFVIITYLVTRHRLTGLAPLVVAMALVQLLFGFVVDYKSEAMIGAILIILTRVLTEGKAPKAWLAAAALFLLVGFPVLQANRTVLRGERGLNASQVAQDIGGALVRAFEARDRVSRGNERAQTAFERLSLKGSVELIVTKTGHGVAYQKGYTLLPILTTFIPKLVWADKVTVETGRIMNREFHISDATDTYISPSALGELYWNFGWPGSLVGMTIVGLLLGYVGTRFELKGRATLTRVLVVIVTAKLLILGSEGALTNQYVVWLRSMLAIGILHLAFARVPVQAAATAGDASPKHAAALPHAPRYPGLLR